MIVVMTLFRSLVCSLVLLVVAAMLAVSASGTPVFVVVDAWTTTTTTTTNLNRWKAIQSSSSSTRRFRRRITSTTSIPSCMRCPSCNCSKSRSRIRRLSLNAKKNQLHEELSYDGTLPRTTGTAAVLDRPQTPTPTTTLRPPLPPSVNGTTGTTTGTEEQKIYTSTTTKTKRSKSMYVEKQQNHNNDGDNKRLRLDKIHQSSLSFEEEDDDDHRQLETVLRRYGLPWMKSKFMSPLNTTTAATTNDDSYRERLPQNDDDHDDDNQSQQPQQQQPPPFYQPFFEWQLNYMNQTLHNLRLIPTTDRTNTKDLTYIDNYCQSSSSSSDDDDDNDDSETRQQQQQQSKSKHRRRKPSLCHHRMITLCFTCDEYRLIRLTLLDGNTSVQVFTSLWYPHPTVNLPVLGIDLLQFANATRHLTVVDFQPIQPTELDHDIPYEHYLRPVRDQYPSLQHTMSKKFYNESEGFFSSQMLLGKSNRSDYVFTELWPAYQSYVQIHTSLVRDVLLSTTADGDGDDNKAQPSTVPQPATTVTKGWMGQKRYDDYSSVRDPAHGLLSNIFGRDYADDFVYDVLFPLCDRPTSSSSG